MTELPRPASEAFFNRFMGPMIALGLAASYMYLLEVVGRKSGRRIVVPVNVMPRDDGEYIIAPRGSVQWVKNLRAADSFVLRRGWRRVTCRAAELEDAEKPALLKLYLERHHKATGQYFPVAHDAPVDAFVAIARNYPVFAVTRSSSRAAPH